MLQFASDCFAALNSGTNGQLVSGNSLPTTRCPKRLSIDLVGAFQANIPYAGIDPVSDSFRRTPGVSVKWGQLQFGFVTDSGSPLAQIRPLEPEKCLLCGIWD